MIILTGSFKTIVALIHNNILALPDGEVIAVMLGHCVFAQDGAVKGKYFRHTLYDLKGRKLAIESPSSALITIKPDQLLTAGWALISRIKDHSCPVIDPTEEWAQNSLTRQFKSSDQIYSIGK